MTVQSDFPPNTRDFIARHIVSVEELEVLLFLHEANDRGWTATEINERLRSQEGSIAKWLETLVAHGLVQQGGSRYRFAPASEWLARETSALAEAYRERRIKVIELIFAKPNESILAFVRAFNLRNKS